MGGRQANDGGQAALWNGLAGRGWVEAQALTDQLYEPLDDLLVDTVAAVSRGAVLDVGCGTGRTTVAVARRLGADSRCTGVDISEPMIAAARARVERDGTPARFIRADAQDYAFEPAERRHDHVALRRDVLRRSGPRLLQLAPGRNGRRRAAVRSHGAARRRTRS